MSIIEVFYQPGKLFASLKDRRAAWVLPLIIDILLVVGATMVMVQMVGMETIVRQRFEGTRLSPEQMEIALSRSRSPAQVYITYASAAVGVPLGLLSVAGILTIFAMVSSKQPKFSTMFSMVALAFLPYWLVSGLMTTLVFLASPDRTSLDVMNLLATNPGAFVDKATTSKGLYSILVSLDLLSFGEIGMLSYGFSKVTKTGLGSGLFAVVTIWILYVLAKTGVSMLF